MEDRENSAKSPDEEVPREYFFFRCPNGHENRILAEEEEKYHKLSDGEIIVHCQFCPWKSAPFKPSFFQHLAPGDVLLWVYTTRKIEKIGSTLNISFDSSPPGEHANFFEPQQRRSQSVRQLSAGKSALKNTAKITRTEHANRPEIAKTEEIALPKTQSISRKSLQNIPRLNERRSNLYFPQGVPPLKIAFPMMSQILKSALWLVAASIFAFFSLRSCERQGDKMASAIKSAGMTLPAQHKGGEKQNPESTPKEIREESKLQMQLKEGEKNTEKWRQSSESWKAIYQKELRARKDLEKQLEMISSHRDNLRKENQKIREEQKRERKKVENILKRGKKFGESFQGFVQAIESEFVTNALDREERDFLHPSYSKDAKFFIFYDDTVVGRKSARKTLKVAMLTKQGKMTFQNLFRTEPIPIKKREIPFMYDWDGRQNAVVLTRIKGLNTIYHIKFRVYDKIVKVLSTRELVSASYPEILGPPRISPSGEYVAWPHQRKLKLMVEVYRLDTASKKCEALGGGDTSKSVAWSPDSKTLFFTTADSKGISAWQFPGKSTTVNFSRQVYGRFMSCSPNGVQLAFFQKSERGKGKVDLCLWEWKKKDGEVKVLQKDIMTVETCRPCWSDGGRFLALIHKGPQESVIVQNTVTRALFTVFRKTGRISWVDWNCPDAIFFTYKEGLYTRPYRVRFTSCFSRY